MNFYWKGGHQIEYTMDLSSFYYVVNDPSFDISLYELFYERKRVEFISIAEKDAIEGEILRFNGFDWYAHNAKCLGEF